MYTRFGGGEIEMYSCRMCRMCRMCRVCRMCRMCRMFQKDEVNR